MDELTERLARCYTGAVHDVLRMMGHENIVLPPAIKSIAPEMRLAGPAWTVAGHLDRTKTRHDTLLGWCTLLAKAPAQHVIVCQPNTHEVALMGELSAHTLKARGILGFVVDGGSRDTELVVEQGFPVFCAFLTPADIVARWVPDRFGEPVTIGAGTAASAIGVVPMHAAPEFPYDYVALTGICSSFTSSTFSGSSASSSVSLLSTRRMRFSSSSPHHLPTTTVATPLPTRLVSARASD